MILCVTIGGVYAAWTYTNPATDITDKGLDTVIGVALPSAEQAGAIGEFKVNTNITSMSIDQMGTNDEGVDFHKAVLNYVTNDDAAPYIEFTLKLVENADQETLDKFKANYSIEIIDVVSKFRYQENDIDIFTDLKPGATEIGQSKSDEDFKWEYDPVREIYACKVLMADEIKLNDFILPSKADHTRFAEALGTPTLKVILSDGIGA